MAAIPDHKFITITEAALRKRLSKNIGAPLTEELATGLSFCILEEISSILLQIAKEAENGEADNA